jgi:hypothetical protein
LRHFHDVGHRPLPEMYLRYIQYYVGHCHCPRYSWGISSDMMDIVHYLRFIWGMSSVMLDIVHILRYIWRISNIMLDNVNWVIFEVYLILCWTLPLPDVYLRHIQNYVEHSHCLIYISGFSSSMFDISHCMRYIWSISSIVKYIYLR